MRSWLIPALFVVDSPLRNGPDTNVSYLESMQEEQAALEGYHADIPGNPEPSGVTGSSETLEGLPPLCEIVDLRIELDLAQIDHPSRWAKFLR